MRSLPLVNFGAYGSLMDKKNTLRCPHCKELRQQSRPLINLPQLGAAGGGKRSNEAIAEEEEDSAGGAPASQKREERKGLTPLLIQPWGGPSPQLFLCTHFLLCRCCMHPPNGEAISFFDGDTLFARPFDNQKNFFFLQTDVFT